jgi:hypothetical protein
MGQLGGSPIGVMPPYAMPVCDTAAAMSAKESFRTSRCRRTVLLMSARSVASTRQAAIVTLSARRPVTTTQLADTSSGTWYVSQNAAVSASAGSISATKQLSLSREMASLTTGASSSG